MIRHVLTFNFHEHVDDDTRTQLLDELATFPERYPTMRNWTMGRNISKRDDTYQWAFVVDFDTEDDLVDYLNSDSHETFVRQRWQPLIKSRAITSFEV